MPDHEALVRSYVHLAQLQRAGEALHMLKRIASMVKPIMRARKWKVGELAEFFPNEAALLGLNINGGQKICLRLRYPGDRNQFLPIENIIDTMLHELAHIVWGPHDSNFHALWDQLRDEYQGLLLKGYTGEGFLTDGRRLGGTRIPQHEARRLAREAAEKRRKQPSKTSSGQRLGGLAPRPGDDIRRVIADAVEKRNRTLKGCATDQLSEAQARSIAESATRNGFRTQAEEDEANEAAIAQALWELVQEDEQKKYGKSYIPPSAENPTGNGGGVVMPERTGPSESRRPWVCEVCTLQNPPDFLCCDACGIERSREAPKKEPSRQSRSPKPLQERVTIDLTESPPKRPRDRPQRGPPPTASSPPSSSAVWYCRFCGTEMERRWWTCFTCGQVKDSSR